MSWVTTMSSKTLLVFLVVYFLSDFSYGQKDEKLFRKDYTYIESQKSFYKVHTTARTFADAKRICALEGASLFYAENGDEANTVISFWNRTHPDIPWVFVGLSDIIAEGFFETVDGRPITEVYSRWQMNRPDNFGGKENCVHLNLQGNLNNYLCDSKSKFICKKSVQPRALSKNCTKLNSDVDGQRHQESFREDYNYVEAAKSFYKIHTTPKNWRDAKRMCALEGASLFYPENRDEANAVLSFWKSHQPDGTWVYVGISDIITEGEFETIDGKSSSEVYNNWAPNQPDNSGDEDCLHFNQLGYFNDIPCSTKYNFICKKSLRSLEQNQNCHIQQSNLDGQKGGRNKTFFRKDYTYIESEESFYKVHTTARNFADAKRICALEGASLFYAENGDEANTVISFWNRTQPNIPWVFVGLSDIKLEGLFETIDGRPITEVYSRWQLYQPDNSPAEQDCVHLNLHGNLNDNQCDRKSNFICKKSLKSLKWNNKCNMPNLDYTFNKDTGKCYKLHTAPLNWADAYAMCRTEYTSLAVISNQKEADYLAKFTRSTPRPRVDEQYERGIYHLGFHNRFNESWRTVRGTPMTKDANAWFANFHPDGKLYKKCGSFLNGRLINSDCNMKSMFVCERDEDCSNSP